MAPHGGGSGGGWRQRLGRPSRMLSALGSAMGYGRRPDTVCVAETPEDAPPTPPQAHQPPPLALHPAPGAPPAAGGAGSSPRDDPARGPGRASAAAPPSPPAAGDGGARGGGYSSWFGRRGPASAPSPSAGGRNAASPINMWPDDLPVKVSPEQQWQARWLRSVQLSPPKQWTGSDAVASIREAISRPLSAPIPEQQRELLWTCAERLPAAISGGRGSSPGGTDEEDGAWPAALLLCRACDWVDEAQCARALRLLADWPRLSRSPDAQGTDWVAVGHATCVATLTAAAPGARALRERALARVFEEPVGALVRVLPSIVGGLVDAPDPGGLLAPLVRRAARDWPVCSAVYWALAVDAECGGDEALKQHLLSAIPRDFRARVQRQRAVASAFAAAQTAATGQRDPAAAEQRLQGELHAACPGARADAAGAPASTPLMPDAEIVGVVPGSLRIFSSAQAPVACRLALRGGGESAVLYKRGDDLRRDQLVLALVAVVDEVMRGEGLCLRLTPYSVVPFGGDTGLVEMVESAEPLSSVMAGHGLDTLLAAGGPTAVDNWVRSNAAYCALSYVLGLGDRHLENLLVCSDGRLVHIDFGFILGEDPKIAPPPMKLRWEMVACIGGERGPAFDALLRFCAAAYSVLRRHRILLVGLLALARRLSGVKLLSGTGGDDSVRQRIEQVELRLRPDLSDADADRHIREVVVASLHSRWGWTLDAAHDAANALRRVTAGRPKHPSS
eukprot:TRINITY_DN6332_c0_g2_i1.p1 TRINITY_DN6332_c0_g2~~TRINITY_DN6332_c0_g2_i1.p1  ORF type:complete len:756 (+),score=215.54 TRINITY_DN6332_c0_g2_i1:72-2270(+)